MIQVRHCISSKLQIKHGISNLLSQLVPEVKHHVSRIQITDRTCSMETSLKEGYGMRVLMDKWNQRKIIRSNINPNLHLSNMINNLTNSTKENHLTTQVHSTSNQLQTIENHQLSHTILSLIHKSIKDMNLVNNTNYPIRTWRWCNSRCCRCSSKWASCSISLENRSQRARTNKDLTCKIASPIVSRRTATMRSIRIDKQKQESTIIWGRGILKQAAHIAALMIKWTK